MRIKLTTLAFQVPITRQGFIEGTRLHIGAYAARFDHFTYNKMRRRHELANRFRFYDREKGCVYFARFDLDNFIRYANKNGVTVDIDEIPPVLGKETTYRMLDHISYKNENQKEAVEFIADPNGPQIRSVALPTGDGKTIGTIWGVQKLHRRSMVMMTSRIGQWVREYQKVTDIPEDRIFCISGRDSLDDLFREIDKTLFPDVILCSSPTFKKYLERVPEYAHLPHPDDFCSKTQVGVIAADEYHEHFFTNFITTLRLNPALFIAITATITSGDQFIAHMMNQLLPPKNRVGDGRFRQYTHIFGYQYDGGGDELCDRNATGEMGYSQNKLESFFLNKGKKFFQRLLESNILPILEEHYFTIAKPGEKLLILCGRTKLCHRIANFLRKVHPEKTVTTFISGDDENVLVTSDIIVSTPGSAGTGRDIKGLKTTFSIIATAATTGLLQNLGRLRPPSDDAPEDPIYVYLYFAVLTKHMEYELKRETLYRQRGKSYSKRRIT